MREITFPNATDFGAVRQAEAFLVSAGFSVGETQAHAPRGLLFGKIGIAKWRGLDQADRDDLHGQMVGNRSSDVTVTLFDSAPHEAVEAFDCALAGHAVNDAMAHRDDEIAGVQRDNRNMRAVLARVDREAVMSPGLARSVRLALARTSLDERVAP